MSRSVEPEIYALDAFLQQFRDVDDVFTEMRKCGSELLTPFLSWEQKIDLSMIDYYYPTSGKVDPSSIECVLEWIVKLWEEKKERLNLTDSSNRRRIERHLLAGSISATRMWLQIRGLKPRTVNKMFITVVDRGRLEVARRFLIDYRTDPSTRVGSDCHIDSASRVNSYTALQIASKRGYLDIVNLLLADTRVDLLIEGLYEAVKNGHLDIVRILLADPRVDPAVNDNRAIRVAAGYGHLDIVEILLDDPRVDPSAEVNAPIRWAASRGHCEVVNRLLADPRVDPTANNNGALLVASEYGHADVVEALLADPRVNPTAYGNEVLNDAIFYGHPDVVRALLSDPRVDPAYLDNNPLRLAAERGHVEIVKLLLADPRVDPSARDNFALCVATRYKQTKVVKVLLADSRVAVSVRRKKRKLSM